MDNMLKKLLSGKLIKLILILVLVLVLLIVFSAKPVVDLDEGVYKEENNKNVPYVVNSVCKETLSDGEEESEEQQIKVVENIFGGYKYDINLDEMTDEIIDILNKNAGSLDMYFSAKNKKTYLKKMIKAELVTQYPNLGGTPPESGFQGAINFIRHKVDGTTKNLEYIPLGNESDTGNNTLYGLINGQRSDSLNKFSLDTEGNLIVAIYTETITKDINGAYSTNYVASEETVDYLSTDKSYFNRAQEQKIYEYKTKKLQYKSLVGSYTMPFEYLWAFLVCCEDEKFVSDLADLVLDSTIDIGIYESLNTNTSVQIESHNTNIWTKEKKIIRTTTWNYGESINTSFREEDYNPTIETEHNYQGTYTTIKTNSITNLAITKADIWYMCQTVQYVREEILESELVWNTVRNYDLDEEFSDGGDYIWSDYIWSGFRTIRATQTETIEENKGTKTQTKNNQYSTSYADSSGGCRYKVSGNPNVTPKTDNQSQESNFSTLFLKSAARKTIDSQEHWFFDILKQNETTANMIDLTKYLITCATGINFGVDIENFDLTIYNTSEFIQVGASASDLLLEYMHFWEASGKAKTNADGTKYIVVGDGSEDPNPTVGYGVDINTSGMRQKFIDAGYADQLHIGGEIDVEFVDSIEEMIIEEKTNGLNSMIEGLNLTTYQKHALISRAYNCGVGSTINADKPGALGIRNGKTFKQAYLTYWEEDDDKFKEKNSNADFNHQLYTTYMNKPITADGQVLSGLIKRRDSEWTLFQTGYYGYKTNINKWYTEFEVETVTAAGNEYPHYLQKEYQNSYGSSTIARSGCGPTSLAMILAGLKGDPSITPITVVENLKRKWPSGSYYIAGTGSSHCIFSSTFLEEYYGVKSEMYPSQNEALNALQQGYPVIGRRRWTRISHYTSTK